MDSLNFNLVGGQCVQAYFKGKAEFTFIFLKSWCKVWLNLFLPAILERTEGTMTEQLLARLGAYVG